MKRNTIATVFLVTSLGCIRPPPDWREQQDLTIQMPSPGGNAKIDMIVDGPTLQALRLAADDFAPPSSEPRDCADTQVAHLYRVSHREDIIFVEVLRDPAACGGQGHTLDGAGAYAISRDGRILRRVLDGEETNAWSDDAGTWSDVPTTLDGRPMFESTAIIDLRYLPLWMFDGGIPPDVLANVVIIWPDGNVRASG